MAIKELLVRSAVPREKACKLADGEGLFLLVKPNGAKLWRMKYRFAGKEKPSSFGAYPEISLSAARGMRLKAKHAIAMGEDRKGGMARPTATYSLIETAKRNGINPQQWLTDALGGNGNGHPIHRIDGLMPWNWRSGV